MASCCDQPGLLPLEDALTHIHNALCPVTDTETLPLADADARVLAKDVVSPVDVPGYNNSAMDGYAIRFEDIGNYETFTLAGKSFAGKPFTAKLGPGECVRIMTGASIPAGADTVVMQENASVTGPQISFTAKIRKGDAVRYRGEDVPLNQTVLNAGRQLGPADIGLLAALGIAQVDVFRKVNVAIFSTGDELRQPGEKLDPGCIYDSNRPTLLAVLRRAGVNVFDYGVVEDDPTVIRSTFIKADTNADVVITSGGVSVGEADYTREVLNELGEITFWKLAIKPGKPLAFGRLANSYFFGLPGNPVSSLITFHQLALPAIQFIGGAIPAPRLRVNAIAKSFIKKRAGRTDFQRGTWEKQADGTITVTTLVNQSSGVLSSVSRANCFVVLENPRGDVTPGEIVSIEPFDYFI